MAILRDIVIVFRLNGGLRALEYRKVPYKAWEELQKEHQLTPANLLAEVNKTNVVAIAAVIWLARRQREFGLSWNKFERESEIMDFEYEPLGVVIDGEKILAEGIDWPFSEKPDPTS